MSISIKGDISTSEGKKELAKRSPINYVEKIKKPLMIVHGSNDIRVKQSESDQIVEKLKENNIPFLYLIYQNEGHGLRFPENRFSFFTYVEEFLAEILKGRKTHTSEISYLPKSSLTIKKNNFGK